MLQDCLVQVVVGSPGSGKTTYAKNLSVIMNAPLIETSAIVSEILQTDSKDIKRRLASTITPEMMFGRLITHLEPSTSESRVVNIISGIRQADIIRLLKRVCGAVYVTKLEIDGNKAIQRMIERDGITEKVAHEHYKLDMELGLGEILDTGNGLIDQVIMAELLKEKLDD